MEAAVRQLVANRSFLCSSACKGAYRGVSRTFCPGQPMEGYSYVILMKASYPTTTILPYANTVLPQNSPYMIWHKPVLSSTRAMALLNVISLVRIPEHVSKLRYVALKPLKRHEMSRTATEPTFLGAKDVTFQYTFGLHWTRFEAESCSDITTKGAWAYGIFAVSWNSQKYGINGVHSAP